MWPTCRRQYMPIRGQVKNEEAQLAVLGEIGWKSVFISSFIVQLLCSARRREARTDGGEVDTERQQTDTGTEEGEAEEGAKKSRTRETPRRPRMGHRGRRRRPGQPPPCRQVLACRHAGRRQTCAMSPLKARRHQIMKCGTLCAGAL